MRTTQMAESSLETENPKEVVGSTTVDPLLLCQAILVFKKKIIPCPRFSTSIITHSKNYQVMTIIM